MIYVEHRPGPPLDQFVDRYWYCEDYLAEHARERVLPDGSMSLVFALAHERMLMPDGDLMAPSLAVGPYQGYNLIDTRSLKRLAGVHFHPGGARRFLGLPAVELDSLHAPLGEIWQPWREERLRERLLAARRPAEAFRALDDALLDAAGARLGEGSEISGAVQALLGAPAQLSVQRLSADLGFSHRRFISLFREEIGLTPKRFSRIRRFRRAVEQAASARPASWADLALACGYFDQAHFVHDFRAFSGLPPSAYFDRRTQWGGHLKD